MTDNKSLQNAKVQLAKRLKKEGIVATNLHWAQDLVQHIDRRCQRGYQLLQTSQGYNTNCRR